MSDTRPSEARTAVGTFRVLADERGVVWVGLPEGWEASLEAYEARHGVVADRDVALEARAVEQLVAYGNGERRAFDLPLHLEGTAFQRSVWDELRRVPFGATCTYADLARRLGSPNASRAVGGANGANPIPVIVPCHRVVSTTGLGGYAGGLGCKQRLLEHEGVLLPA